MQLRKLMRRLLRKRGPFHVETVGKVKGTQPKHRPVWTNTLGDWAKGRLN